MTSKLPALSAPKVISVLARHGFLLDRQSGSHAVFIHPDGRKTTVPIRGKRDLGKGLLRQIMKDAELTIDGLLKECRSNCGAVIPVAGLGRNRVRRW